jgi:DNA invertase Pin-like site-specific DNA recombinase
MSLIGYIGVSKSDGLQAPDLQRDTFIAAGVDPGHLYEERASGKQEDHPHLDACLKAPRPGDTLPVWKLERLGRNLRHLVNIVHDLTAREVGLKVLSGQGVAIDTTSTQGSKGGRPFKMAPAKVRLAMASMGHSETNVAALCQAREIARQTPFLLPQLCNSTPWK